MITSTSRVRRNRLATAAVAAAAIVALSGSTVSPATAEGKEPTSLVVMTPALQKKIQERVESFRTSHSLSGVSVAVVTPDPSGSNPVVTTFVAGQLSLESAVPVDASTQFELGSETKVFTADLLSYLVASERVSLDDAVQLYAPAGITVPEWVDPETGATTPVTLRDLATHQSALPDVPANFQEGCGDDPYCVNPHPGYTQTMLWDAIAQQPLLWKPGTNWLYSNFAYGLLGTILANVVAPVPSADPPAYQNALDEAFLDALGMSSTVVETPGPALATPYLPDNVPTWYWDNTNAISGAGGLISSATDMGNWVAAHLGYTTPDVPLGVRAMAATLDPVSTITVQCQSATDCPPPDPPLQMGLGWQLYAAEASNVGAHWAFKNGGTAGFSSDTALAPSLRVGVTTMFNQQRVENDQIAVPILALLIAEQTSVIPTPTGDHAGEHHKAELAESGIDRWELIVPGLSAATLLSMGALLTMNSRRRKGTIAR